MTSLAVDIYPPHPVTSQTFSPSSHNTKSPSPLILSHKTHLISSSSPEHCPDSLHQTIESHTDEDDTMPIEYRHTRAASASPPTIAKALPLSAEDKDVFRLPPTVALTLLARSIEVLVSLTGDIPPTPPLSNPSSPSIHPVDGSASKARTPNEASASLDTGFCFGTGGADEVDGVRVKKRRPSREPEVPENCAEEGKFIAAGVDNVMQYSAITRKFWSKSVPEIPIEEYIFRIHRFCPMSTAVYIAASLYLHRIAVLERVIPITRFNVHRLVLAALRVASKALEDLSHSHRRFAKVGGLSENELSRLEVSFCFLVNFELKVTKATLERQVMHLRQIAAKQVTMGKPALQPRLPKDLQSRSVVSVDV